MLRFPELPADPRAAEIVKNFVNDRLIDLMESIILEEVLTTRIMEGDDFDLESSFEDLVDIDNLMTDMDFAENVSLEYLPENYPLEKANYEFFGLYKLLRARDEYVPELPMEYILYHIIEDTIWQIDQINEDMEEGDFDIFFSGEDMDEEDGFHEDDGIIPLSRYLHEKESKHGNSLDGGVITTVLRIPEPERSIVLEALDEETEGEDITGEDLICEYEDLREYLEICFWDTDFAFLDMVDEGSLIHSDAGELMGLSERRDTKIIEFPIDKSGKRVKAEIKMPPWSFEDNDDFPFN